MINILNSPEELKQSIEEARAIDVTLQVNLDELSTLIMAVADHNEKISEIKPETEIDKIHIETSKENIENLFRNLHEAHTQAILNKGE